MSDNNFGCTTVVETPELRDIFRLIMSQVSVVDLPNDPASSDTVILPDVELSEDGLMPPWFDLYFYLYGDCLLYTSPSPRDATLSRMPSSA